LKYTSQTDIASLNYFRFNALRQKDSWLSPAYVGVDQDGMVGYLSDIAPEASISFEAVTGYALPGFQNSHSHAFQYAMAGLAEKHAPGILDDFWSWREAMYQCALSMDPNQVEAVATMLYTEMLRFGYTSVAEFHYLHHDKNGSHYHNLAEMGERIIAAANTAGIKLTLIPVFYQQGGFGMDPQPRQRRFISKSRDDYFKLLDSTQQAVKNNKDVHLGFSVHSLRAVNLEDVKATYHESPRDIPFHIHLAEQKKEVIDCLTFCGKRPVEWMLENLPVNDQFHLVHCTHLNDKELKSLASSGAGVVLCPSTEGNLGDGIFRMKDYMIAGGHWSIGTDSHIGLNPLEELRMIDYGQRLVTGQRNALGTDPSGYLINLAQQNGRLAMGEISSDFFEKGKSFDAVVYAANGPLMSTTSLNNILSTIIFSPEGNLPYGTLVNGKWVVKNQHHQRSSTIKSAFTKAMRALQSR
jgi:formimidoylglutamate deiminase